MCMVPLLPQYHTSISVTHMHVGGGRLSGKTFCKKWWQFKLENVDNHLAGANACNRPSPNPLGPLLFSNIIRISNMIRKPESWLSHHIQPSFRQPSAITSSMGVHSAIARILCLSAWNCTNVLLDPPLFNVILKFQPSFQILSLSNKLATLYIIFIFCFVENRFYSIEPYTWTKTILPALDITNSMAIIHCEKDLISMRKAHHLAALLLWCWNKSVAIAIHSDCTYLYSPIFWLDNVSWPETLPYMLEAKKLTLKSNKESENYHHVCQIQKFIFHKYRTIYFRTNNWPSIVYTASGHKWRRVGNQSN